MMAQRNRCHSTVAFLVARSFPASCPNSFVGWHLGPARCRTNKEASRATSTPRVPLDRTFSLMLLDARSCQGHVKGKVSCWDEKLTTLQARFVHDRSRPIIMASGRDSRQRPTGIAKSYDWQRCGRTNFWQGESFGRPCRLLPCPL